MNACALIVAAGLSSRMGNFKPMIRIGDLTIAEHGIKAIRDAGVGNIVMVTGFRHNELEFQLRKYGIHFVHNPQYENSHMFDSICLGLRHIESVFPDNDKVLFFPVDIPFFSADTVRLLLRSDAPLSIPTCLGKCGHPIAWDRNINQSLLCSSGERGLKGAFIELGISPVHYPVNDKGILLDADTQKDLDCLIAYFNSTNKGLLSN